MPHKGNFNVTEMGRIALSLQELIDRQAAEIAGLKEERGKLQSRLNQVQSQLKDSAAKNARLVEMHKWNLDFMEKQSQTNKDLTRLLEERNKRPRVRFLRLLLLK